MKGKKYTEIAALVYKLLQIPFIEKINKKLILLKNNLIIIIYKLYNHDYPSEVLYVR